MSTPLHVDPPTLLAALHALVMRDPAAPLLVDGGSGRTWSRREFVEAAERLAGELAEIGRLRGVGLLMNNRPEYFLVDTAAMMAGAVPVSLYPTASAEQLRALVDHADLDILFVEAGKLGPLLEAVGEMARPPILVVLDAPWDLATGMPEAALVRFEALAESQALPIQLVEAVGRVKSSDLATIVYTSGSTGAPKGVRLTHANLLAAARGIGGRAGVVDGDEIISWLPHAHVAERTCHYACSYLLGLVVTTCADPADLPRLLCAVQPHWFGAFPRFWEKLKMRAEAEMARAHSSQVISRALELGRTRLRPGNGAPGDQAERDELAQLEAEVLAPLRDRLGLGRARTLNTGSAPTPPAVREFFASIGLFIGDIYGASETATAGTMATMGPGLAGGAGTALPGIEVKLEADGEILLRGAAVMAGYHKAPAQTAAALTTDGWYRTGDLGALDADGELWITGRKKELIIGLGGHNMSPSYIESVLKGDGGLVAHVCVIGDGRPYNTALVALDPELAWAYVDRNAGLDLAEVAGSSWIEAHVAERIAVANARLSRVEQVKRFAIVPEAWLPGSSLVTPTLKLRREAIGQAYAGLVEALYASDLQPGCLSPALPRA